MWIVVEWKEEKSVSVLKEKDIAKKGKENANLVGETVDVPLSGKDGFAIHKAKVLAVYGNKTEALNYEKSLIKPVDDCQGKRKRKLTAKAREFEKDESSKSDDEVTPTKKKTKERKKEEKQSKVNEEFVVVDDSDDGDEDADKEKKEKKKPKKKKKLPPLQDKVHQERVQQVLSIRRNQALETNKQQSPTLPTPAIHTVDEQNKQSPPPLPIPAPIIETRDEQNKQSPPPPPPHKEQQQKHSLPTPIMQNSKQSLPPPPPFVTPPRFEPRSQSLSYTPLTSHLTTLNPSTHFITPPRQISNLQELPSQHFTTYTRPHQFDDENTHTLTPLTTNLQQSTSSPWMSQSNQQKNTSMLSLLNDDYADKTFDEEQPVPGDFNAYVMAEFQKLKTEIAALKSEVKHLRKKKNNKENIEEQEQLSPERKLEALISSFSDPRQALKEMVFASFTKEELKSKTIKGVKTWKCGEVKPEALDSQKLEAILNVMQSKFSIAKDKTKTMLRNIKRGIQYK